MSQLSSAAQAPIQPSRPPRQLKRRLNSDTIAQILHDYREGATAAQLAAEHRLSKNGIIALLRNQGAHIRRRPIPPSITSQAAALYNQGMTIADLATRFNVARNSLRLALINNGVTMRPRGRQPSRKPR